MLITDNEVWFIVFVYVNQSFYIQTLGGFFLQSPTERKLLYKYFNI